MFCQIFSLPAVSEKYSWDSVTEENKLKNIL